MDPQAPRPVGGEPQGRAHAGYRAADLEGSRTGVYVGARSAEPAPTARWSTVPATPS